MVDLGGGFSCFTQLCVAEASGGCCRRVEGEIILHERDGIGYVFQYVQERVALTRMRVACGVDDALESGCCTEET